MPCSVWRRNIEHLPFEIEMSRAPQEGGDAQGQDLEADAQDGNKTEAPKPSFKEETRTRKKILRTALKVEGPGLVFPALSSEALKASSSVVLPK